MSLVYPDYFKGTREEFVEYCNMQAINDGETPTEWKNRIWNRLTYFREKNLINRRWIDATKALHLENGDTCYPHCGIAICYSCDQLVYTGKIAPHERIWHHWATVCSGNKFCDLDFKEYMKIKREVPFDKLLAFHHYNLWMENPSSRFRRKFPYDESSPLYQYKLFSDKSFELHRYGLWMENAARRIRRIRNTELKKESSHKDHTNEEEVPNNLVSFISALFS